MYPIIGLMSGTSMDGINAILVYTNGTKLKSTSFNLIRDYSKKTQLILNKALENIQLYTNNSDFKHKLDKSITKDHYKAIKELIKKSLIIPEFIGFHGQTIFHNSQKKISIQAGDAELLANLLNIKVISNFRDRDLKFGGEGAPISPIYHKYLMENLKLKLPSCFINVGGIANLTFWDKESLLAFDTGPGNCLMDMYMQKTLGKKFDRSGLLASKGKVNSKLVFSFLQDPYFRMKSPKSLDRNYFKKYLKENALKDMTNHDVMANLLEFTIESISMAIEQLPSKPSSIVVMGGGINNKFLIKRLLQKLNNNILFLPKEIFSAEMVEAELIAFLSARTLYNLPITFPSTTGVKKKCLVEKYIIPKN